MVHTSSHKPVAKYFLYNEMSTILETIRYLMYKYDISFDDWDQYLSYILIYNTDHTIIDNVYTTSGIMREIQIIIIIHKIHILGSN